MINNTSNSIVAHIINWSDKQRIQFVGIVTLFISFIHLVFKPFQLAHYPTPIFIEVNLYYFAISCLCLLFFFYIIPKHFHKKYLNILSSRSGRFLYLFSSIFSIGIGFFIYKIIAGFYPLSLDRIGTGLLAIFALGLIPVLIWNKIDSNVKQSVKYYQITDSIQVESNRILFIESNKNYVNWNLLENDKIKIIKIRSSLKKTMSQLDPSQFVQCHKAFIVNISKIDKISRKHSSFEAQLNGLEIKVPVSRSFKKNLD